MPLTRWPKQAPRKRSKRFAKNFSFHLAVRRDTLRITDIEGIVLMVRIPVLPDGIYPTELFLDSSRENIDISALAVNGHLALEGSVNVRSRQFNGINWKKTLKKNWKLVFSVFRFLRY